MLTNPNDVSKNAAHHRVSHSLYTAMKRLIHTLIISVAVALVIGLVLMYQRYQTHWINVQTTPTGTSISRQYAKILQPAVSLKDRAQMEKLINVALEEPAVVSMSVFDAKGKYLAPLPKTDSVVTMTRNLPVPPSTHVALIVDDKGTHVGYINVHIDTEYLLFNPVDLRNQLGFIVIAVIVLSLIIGVYITRGFYKFRPWIIRVIQS